MHLLLPAAQIQIHDQVSLLCLKVCRRIVEREVSVFTNADEGGVNGLLLQDLPHAAAFDCRVALGIQKVVSTQVYF